MRFGRLIAIVMCALSVACGPGFAPGDRIERTRVVFARVHVTGDPTRASLLASETATIEYLIVSPPMMSMPMRTSFVGCVQASMAGLNGVAGCAGPTFDAASADVAAAVVPTLTSTIAVPSDLVPGFSTNLITYLGTCIGQGESTIDPTVPTASCTQDSRSELYELQVHVVPDIRLANRNPNIHDERYYIGDALWTEPDPSVPATGCGAIAPSSVLPNVSMAGHDSPLLIFGCSPDDREMYPAFDADAHPIIGRENIDIQHFVTLGTIASATRINDDDVGLIESTRWNRPALHDLTADQQAALSSGLLVRVWFVARDGRGGSDWLERDLCLVP